MHFTETKTITVIAKIFWQPHIVLKLSWIVNKRATRGLANSLSLVLLFFLSPICLYNKDNIPI